MVVAPLATEAIAERQLVDAAPEPKRTISETAGNVALLAVFALCVCILSFRTFFDGNEQYSEVEKRKLADCPKLHRKSIATFPAKFEAFLRDRMGFRKELIRTRNLLKYDLFNVSGSSMVLLGKQDWLYYLSDGSPSVMRRERPFSAENLAYWKRVLEQRTKWCQQHGIKYVFVVAPDKPSIYPEFLPAGYKPVRPKSRLDQLSAMFDRDSPVRFVNLSKSLLSAKSANQLYLKTDTHWNQLGAYVGYQQLMSSLRGWVPALKSTGNTHSDFEMKVCFNGDCVGLLGMFSCKNEMVPSFTNCHATTKPSNLKVLVFHDSFGEGLKPYLSANFNNINWVHQNDLSFDSELVLREHPQILIHEVVERHAANYDVQDWRQWITNTLLDNGAKHTYVTLLPNTPEISVGRFSRSEELKAADIKPTSCREWTEAGDKVSFESKSALYSDWYLLKTGDQGFEFINDESAAAYKALERFVRQSGNFVMVDELSMQEGSKIQLYKRTPN